MELKKNQILIIGIIAIALIFILPKLGLFSVSNIGLDADCSGSSNLNCNIIQSTVQVSDGYTIKMRTPELSKFNEVLRLFVIQNVGLNDLLTRNSIADSSIDSMRVSTQDLYSKYSDSFEGCGINTCNGVQTSIDNGCPFYTLTSDGTTYDLNTYRGLEDYRNGRITALCTAIGGTLVGAGGSFYDGNNYLVSPRYYKCVDIKSYCGGYVYNTNTSISYIPKNAVTDWGQTSIQNAQYQFSLHNYLELLNGYECSWQGTANGIYDSSIVKSFNIKGYTVISGYEIKCIFNKVPNNFWQNDDVYVNDKNFNIDFTKKYIEPVKQDYYRFQNNECILVNEYEYDKLVNDYSKVDCETKIVKSNGQISIPINETPVINNTIIDQNINVNNGTTSTNLTSQTTNSAPPINNNFAIIVIITIFIIVLFILIK
jgi:hypothetical protein